MLLCTTVFAGDVEIGLSLLSAGKFNEACQYIHRAYEDNPSVPKVQFAYAMTEPDGLKAKTIYKSIVDNKKAPDSLKAEACSRLGDFYCCKEDYDKAQRFYSRAEKILKHDSDRHMKALAIFKKGDNRTAESIWLGMVSSEQEAGSADQARYYLGNAFYQQGNYEQAFNCYVKASRAEGSEWAAPALTGACLSAANRGETTHSTILFEQIQKKYPAILEKELLKAVEIKPVSFVEADIGTRDDFGAVEEANQPEKSVPEDVTEPEEVKEPQKEIEPQRGLYTLQVGAFGSTENARNLQKKMRQHFDHVTVKEEIVRGIKYLKVRVGSFSKEEEALAYGEKFLRGNDIAFRVVKE